jgi:tripartite-type tricarboxylate transporter receptor subunit TctC
VSVGSAAAQPQSDTDAAAFPNRAINIVVPFPVGGPSDVLARMIGQRMSEDWSQPVLIENQVGANIVIGAQAVQKAWPMGTPCLWPRVWTLLPLDLGARTGDGDTKTKARSSNQLQSTSEAQAS